ncbi:hypothetical protein C6I20_13080 [Aeromicrobium sp. A1-2]|uniref:hypothetical protein n=1 Tax=Aeromicrobium sp. A1-2 TaxID=2107713 RepID=UPI000E47A115|nr:hypothetical protein [Aeromicrobium sp. A1-2]AXT86026.1 hypothetical protein C6I20_13080 [Aeromicrobium sp. A1-2]
MIASRRDDRGQGSVEHLGAIVISVAIILALLAAMIAANPQIGEAIAYQVCKVVHVAGGPDCTAPDAPPSAEDRIPQDPCLEGSDNVNASAQLSVVVTIRKGWIYLTEEMSDGTFRVTRVRENSIGTGFGPGFDASVTIDGKKYGIVGNVSADALIAGNMGSTWYAGSQSEAEQIINDSLKEEAVDTTIGSPPLIGGLLSGAVKHFTGQPPKPDETYVEGGVQVSGQAAVSNVLFGGQVDASLEGYAGFKEGPDGYTVYIKGNTSASMSIGGVWGPAEDPAAGAEFVYEAHYDKNWEPEGLTMTTATYADSSGYDEGDTRVVTEHVFTVPVTDDASRELFDDALINPLAFFDVSEEAKRSGYYAKNTYDVDENTYGGTLDGKLIGEYGGGVEGGTVTQDLTDAQYWDGAGFSDRPDCLV